MANVYTAGSDRRLIIYSISRYIFLRTAYIDGIERPIMLASDFLDGLSDVCWETQYIMHIRTRTEIFLLKM